MLQTTDQVPTPRLPAVDTVVDTIRVVDQRAYIDLLERTNQQLGLWTNPYALMVAALAVLFTALAIVGAFVIYRQGQDHQKQIDRFLDNYRSVLDQFVAQTNHQVELTISELRTQLETATDEQKTHIAGAIARLERQRAGIAETARSGPSSLGKALQQVAMRTPASDPNPPISGPPNYTGHECYKCNFKWNQADGADTNVLACPSCGAVQSFHGSLKF